MEGIIKNLKIKNEVRSRKSWRALKIEEARLEKLDLKDLWKKYWLKVRVIEARFPDENNRTLAESEFIRKIKAHTTFEIHPGFWVGPWQVDAYLPEINALVEIDGSIHESEGKMYCDSIKFKKLAKLFGNWPISFSNQIVYSNFKYVLNTLERLPRLDYREKELQIKRLLLTTLESD